MGKSEPSKPEAPTGARESAVSRALGKKHVCDHILSFIEPPEQVAIMAVNIDVMRSVSSRLYRVMDGEHMVDLIGYFRTPMSRLGIYLTHTREIDLRNILPAVTYLPTPLELFDMCPNLDTVVWDMGRMERRGPISDAPSRFHVMYHIEVRNAESRSGAFDEIVELGKERTPDHWSLEYHAARAGMGSKAFVTFDLGLVMESITTFVGWEAHLTRILNWPLSGVAIVRPTMTQLRTVVDILTRKNLPRAGCLHKGAGIRVFMPDWWAVVRTPGWLDVFRDLRALGLPVKLNMGADGYSYWSNESIPTDERNGAWAKLLAVSPYIEELHLYEPINPLLGPPGGGSNWEIDEIMAIKNADDEKTSRLRRITYCIRYTDHDRDDLWMKSYGKYKLRFGLYPYARMLELMGTKNCRVQLVGIIDTETGTLEDGIDRNPMDRWEWEFRMSGEMVAHQQYFNPDSDFLYPVVYGREAYL